MASFKQSKIKFGFLETATSGGTLTLTSSSKQYQILTGSANHSVVLPNSTTLVVGVSFTIINVSTGTVTVYLNDGTTVLTTLAAGVGAAIVVNDISTSNGIWSTKSGASATNHGLVVQGPGATKTSNYTIVSGDDSGIINVDTSAGAVTVTLPSPTAGFVITIKDVGGNADTNAITIARNGSEKIDDFAVNISINEKFGSVSLVADGTNWSRFDEFVRNGLANTGRGLFFGGSDVSASTNVIDYVEIATASNATDFGDLTSAKPFGSGCGNSIRGLLYGSAFNSTAVDYVSFATLGNGSNFGDLTQGREAPGSISNTLRGIFCGGNTTSGAGGQTNIIDYFTIATLGNAIDFGDLTNARSYASASINSYTRGIACGGFIASPSNTIDYVTIATIGNATSFGSLSQTHYSGGGCSSPTRGVYAGGFDASNAVNFMEYLTIANTANAIDFGDLTESRGEMQACSSQIRAVFGGGSPNSGRTNTIDYMTFTTLANATDFGDMTVARRAGAASNCHGGLYG